MLRRAADRHQHFQLVDQSWGAGTGGIVPSNKSLIARCKATMCQVRAKPSSYLTCMQHTVALLSLRTSGSTKCCLTFPHLHMDQHL